LIVRKENSMNPEHPRHSKPPPSFWPSRTGLALLGFAAIAGFFLLTEHRAHLLGVLPWLLLFACPLLHLFMHRGHGGHGEDEEGKAPHERGRS
jgi:hypothetical protein